MTNTASFFPYQLLWGLAAASPSALSTPPYTVCCGDGFFHRASWTSFKYFFCFSLTSFITLGLKESPPCSASHFESLAASFTFCLTRWHFLGVNNMAAHTLISPVFLKHHYMSFKHFPFALTAALIGSRGFHSFSDFWHSFFIKLNHGEKYQISIWLMVRKHETYPLTRAHRGLSCHRLAWFQYCVTGNRGVRGEGKTGDVWLLGLSEHTGFLSAVYCM